MLRHELWQIGIHMLNKQLEKYVEFDTKCCIRIEKMHNNIVFYEKIKFSFLLESYKM